MTTTGITMLDVFRSMHSMNVEHVRQLFAPEFRQIILEKDAKIHNLERQLCAINNSSGYKCANCAKLAQDIDNVTKHYQTIINNWQTKLNSDRQCIDSLNSRIESLNGELQWTRDTLNSLQHNNDIIVAQKAQQEFDKKNLEQSLATNGQELVRLRSQIDNQRTIIQSHESKASVQKILITKLKNNFNVSDEQMDKWIMDAYMGF